MNNSQEILRNRRKNLEKDKKIEQFANKTEIVVFQLNQETYGIESKYVKEAISIREITPLPHVPEFILGLINYRRKILSVVDLKKVFGISHLEKKGGLKVLVLEDPSMEFGLIVDTVHNVQWIEMNELETNFVNLNGIYEKYFMGLYSGSIILLNGKKILSDSNFVIDITKG